MSDTLEKVGFVVLVVCIVGLVIFGAGAVLSIPGYVILMLFGEEYTLWTGAAVGAGTIMLLFAAGYAFGLIKDEDGSNE